MSLFVSTRRKVAFGAVGALAAVGLGGTAYAATTSSGSPGPTAGAATPAAHAHHRARSLVARSDHATIEVKVKGHWVTYTLDRGQVSAVSPTSITLARPDGQSVTDAITSTTKLRGVTSEPAIQQGKPALVVSTNGDAVRIHQAVK
ncbi:MAG: hypothetical protein ACRDY0_01070 [Acidimicrobiales bacterium]